MSMILKIAVDVDEVLAQFNAAAARVVNRLRPGLLPKDFDGTPYGWIKQYGVEDILWSHIQSSPNWWMSLDAYAKNVWATIQFAHAGPHVITLCTARARTVGGTVEKQTMEWLRMCGFSQPPIGYVSAHVVDSSKDKRMYYQVADIKYSVDDFGPTVEECNKIPGHIAFVLDRPWNKEYVGEPRVESLDEFFYKISAIEKGKDGKL